MISDILMEVFIIYILPSSSLCFRVFYILGGFFDDAFDIRHDACECMEYGGNISSHFDCKRVEKLDISCSCSFIYGSRWSENHCWVCCVMMFVRHEVLFVFLFDCCGANMSSMITMLCFIFGEINVYLRILKSVA